MKAIPSNMDALPLQRFRCGHTCAAPRGFAVRPHLTRSCVRLLTVNTVEEKDMQCPDCRAWRKGDRVAFGQVVELAMPLEGMTWSELLRHPDVQRSFESGKAIEL